MTRENMKATKRQRRIEILARHLARFYAKDGPDRVCACVGLDGVCVDESLDKEEDEMNDGNEKSKRTNAPLIGKIVGVRYNGRDAVLDPASGIWYPPKDKPLGISALITVVVGIALIGLCTAAEMIAVLIAAVVFRFSTSL